MDTRTFESIIGNTSDASLELLLKKNDSYGSEQDRLRAFKQAAQLQDVSVRKALGGMMAKHTTSLYDMIDSDEEFDMGSWDEKILDHINYLLLLKAVVYEDLWGLEGDTLEVLDISFD